MSTGGKVSIKTSLRQALLVSFSVVGALSVDPYIARAADAVADQGSQLQEVIVTAQKRSERLQDVPVPVTAISADTLLNQNELRLQDYYSIIPGLSLTPSDFGVPQLTIRGLSTGSYSNPTVGITVDDVPFGSSTLLGNGEEVPDFDPSDLARVEVLRGPQGTLYGASSIGGLVKYVTVDPSTDGVSGNVQAGTSSVYNGAELGYSFRGAVNLPVSDTLAVRASGFTRVDPGYVDNVLTGQDGANRGDSHGVRLSTLWRPSQELSLKVTALYQRSTLDGSPMVYVGPGLGDLQQNNARGTGASEKTLQAYSALLTAKLGAVDLVSISGYTVSDYHESLDLTPVFGPLTENGVPGSGFNGFGVTGTPAIQIGKTSKFTQELRLSGSIGSSTDWLAGAFYNHEDTQYAEDILATDSVTGAVAGLWLHEPTPNTFTEYAAFADITYHFTDRFDVQIGGRESQNRQTLEQSFYGIFAPVILGLPSGSVEPEVHSKENAFTYLVTPQLKVSPDLMVYARLASGYRPGGPNYFVPGVPSQYGRDTTQNYELGAKGETLNHTLSFDVSLYYIDWKDIQLVLAQPVTGSQYSANGSRAKSQGVEFSVQSKPLAGLTISAWVAWSDAVLTEALPPASTAYGAAGDRLPFGSRYSGNLALQEDFSIASSWTGFVGGSASYVGDREGIFASSFDPTHQRQILPAYTKADLRAGVMYGSWKVNLFLDNVADKRGLLTGGVGTAIPNAFTYIQPRTVGVSVAKTF